MIQTGDIVRPRGKFKKVVDFLAGADRETLRMLSSFFGGDNPDPVKDAKRLQKPNRVNKVYSNSLDVAMLKGEFLWEEQLEYWEQVNEATEEPVTAATNPEGKS